MVDGTENISVGSPQRPVWFRLLDADTGEPYKGTSATKVFVASSADVADFRDAVHSKYDKPNYLRDIPSGALIVYKNKAAFDKRNAAVDDGKEEPLDPTESLGNLGSKQDMLVVTPPQTLAQNPDLYGM